MITYEVRLERKTVTVSHTTVTVTAANEAEAREAALLLSAEPHVIWSEGFADAQPRAEVVAVTTTPIVDDEDFAEEKS